MKNLFFLFSLSVLLVSCENRKGMNHNDSHREVVENEKDRETSQKVRQSLMDDDSLSTNAKNIKILTRDGVVVLKGSVNSDAEKENVARKAKAIIGVKNVDNQLDILVIERVRPENK